MKKKKNKNNGLTKSCTDRYIQNRFVIFSVNAIWKPECSKSRFLTRRIYAVSCATCNGLLLIILFDYTVRPRQTAYPFKIRKNDRKNYRQNIISKTRRKIPKTILYLDVRTNNYFNPTVNGRRKGFTKILMNIIIVA